MTGVARFDCYPSDLLNGLIGLTSDQIAVYVVILLLQYDRGEAVRIDGREHELAIRSGLTRGRLTKAVAELARMGKLQQRDGLVWNGRAEEELSKIRARILRNAENSAKGGHSTRLKFEAFRNEINDGDRPVGQPVGQPSLGSNSPPPPPLPLEDKSPSETRPKIDFQAGFEDRFWPLYPNKVGRRKALESWIAARRRGADVEAIIEGLRRYLSCKPPDRPWLNPTTFLNQERFNDEYAPTGAGVVLLPPAQEPRREMSADERRRRADEFDLILQREGLK